VIRAIVVDIEGTTTPITFVKDVLFPFARARRAGWIAAHPDAPETRALGADPVATALRFMDEDRKDTALKAIQGLIWEDGYARGELIAPVYDDVAPALRAWRSAGIRLAVYSSGSVHAQRLLFAHTTAGDLTPLFEAYFDTTTGPKQEAASYAKIAAALAVSPADVLFLSDTPAEIAAARAAGLAAIEIARDAVDFARVSETVRGPR
jgi:enolase-phosphatase E1